MKNDELMHHGIKGQKWGVRRYQNKDGSLTAEGRRRKLKNLDRLNMSRKRVMLGKTPATQYKWYDKDGDTVAEFKVWDWWDGKNVSDLEISKKYRGIGLSYQLLDYATKKCGAKNLAVRKDNTIAKHVYDKYGFETTETDDEYYYMSLKESKDA